LEHLVVATDGSEQNAVAAWAAIFPQLDDCITCGCDSEDQSAFRAEFDAILCVLQLVCLCVDKVMTPVLHKVVIISDCQAAITVATKGGGQCPKLGMRATHCLDMLKTHGITVEFCWVPSHGKTSPLFRPHSLVSEGNMRTWNDMADIKARSCMRSRLAGSLRSLWALHRADARNWEVAAIHLSANVGRQYMEHLDLLQAM
jgi:hypothetical protein